MVVHAEPNMNDMVHELQNILASANIEDSYIRSPGYLSRWIVGKNCNLDHARSAIVKTVKWREENGIEGILTENFDDVWAPFEFLIEGHDIDKRPIVMIYSSEIETIDEKDIKKEFKKALKDRDRGTRYVYFLAETLSRAIQEASIETEGRVNNCLILIDMKGVEIINYVKQFRSVIPILTELTEVCEQHYPGMLHQVFLVNAPKKSLKVFSAMAKPLLRSDSMDMVKIFGKKPEKWRKVLLEYIPADQLSPEYGGTKRCEPCNLQSDK